MNLFTWQRVLTIFKHLFPGKSPGATGDEKDREEEQRDRQMEAWDVYNMMGNLLQPITFKRLGQMRV